MQKPFLIPALLALVLGASVAYADCGKLPNFQKLQEVLKQNVKASGGPSNGGYDLNMWASVVDRDGTVCAVAYSGKERGDQWLGSRVISAQKANTANAFSLPTLAVSTANLYSAVQPGGSLFGLQESNPVDTSVAYGGDFTRTGTRKDPMVGKKIGGINVFGGGLALYTKEGEFVGAIGISGDTACSDHNVAWRIRAALGLDKIPAGVSADKNDAIIYDINSDGKSKSGFGHPVCGAKEKDIAKEIKAVG